MLTPDEIKKMTGQMQGERIPTYKLDEVSMSGNDGEFTIRGLSQEKGSDGKYPKETLGHELSVVALKMRWRLFKYTEGVDGSAEVLSTTEYDNKNTDTVTVFPSKEKGLAVAMKEKYGLSTQRVIYAYLPAKQRVVRLIVKASGLTGDKNPNKELGLFEYIDDLNTTNTLLHEFITVGKGVFRADPKGNKRKDYMAMSFSCGRKLTEPELAKVLDLIQEVHEKIGHKPVAATEETEGYDDSDMVASAKDTKPATVTEYERPDISPDDIPF